MTIRKKLRGWGERTPAETEPEPEPQPTLFYEIYPDNIADGSATFDDVEVHFSKPGWRWYICTTWEGSWPQYVYSDVGFPTRDAALVNLLAHIKESNANPDEDADLETSAAGA